MPDMLVKLYNLKNDWEGLEALEEQGILIRKPIGPEKHRVLEWVRREFEEIWVSETDIAISNQPTSCFIAIQNHKILGFACYDATALGLFGPTGVGSSHRGKGIGKALLLASLHDMRFKGYAYAVVGYTNQLRFYEKTVGAVEIPDSFPGLWETWLER